MSTKQFAAVTIRKISGGRDPVHLVEEFLLHQGFDPHESLREFHSDSRRWMIPLGEGRDLEIILQNLKKLTESTLYMGVNIAVVPLRGASDMLIAALEIADGLVGLKISLVGHHLVMSASLSGHGLNAEDLQYNFKLIDSQRKWFCAALANELGWSNETLG